VWRVAVVNPAAVPCVLERARLECQLKLGAKNGRWDEKRSSGWAVVLEDGREYDPVRPHVVGAGAVAVLQVVLHDTAPSESSLSGVALGQGVTARLRFSLLQRRPVVSGVAIEWTNVESEPVALPGDFGGIVEEHTLHMGLDAEPPDVHPL